MNWWIPFVVLVSSSTVACQSAERGPTGVTQDIEFAVVDGVSLKLDAFIPEGDGPFPTCILVHGGGYIKGDQRSYIDPLFEPLSQAGFAWFTINYRLAPDHRWPACAEDVETAIRWVKEHAEEFKVDTDRIALIGESAGGHLVSYVGTRTKGPTTVAAVVAFYAPHDLEYQVRQRQSLGDSMMALFGVTELNADSYEKLRNASASTYVEHQMPPYLLIHGDKDTGVPIEQSIQFQKRLKKHGNVCDLIKIAGGNHGMGGWKKLNSGYQDQMIAWLKKTLQTTDHRSIGERLEGLGPKVTQKEGRVSRVEFANCAKLGIPEFGLIGKFTDMTSLVLYGQCHGLTDKSLPQLSSLINLEDFSTEGIQVSDQGLSEFARFPKLKSMSFFHTSLGMKGFDGRGFAAFKNLPELRQLTIAGTSFNDAGMAAISEIKQLRDFRTWHTFQTQAGNEWLTRLPELKSLWLGQRLRRYDGGSNAPSLNNETFDVLIRLKTLESLTLHEARLSMAALTRLRDLPNLKRLDLRDIDLQNGEIDGVKSALPSVKVDWKPMTDEEKDKLTAYLKE